MLVIEGKSEKSIRLEKFIRMELLNTNLLVIDAVGELKFLDPDWMNIWHTDVNQSTEEFITTFKKNYENSFSKFDWIALYLNVPKSNLEILKELDRLYPQNFIVTIQSNKNLTNYFV
ncbi:hypothetical protein MOB44_19655 [Bacillus sonorensis]|uniref:hypothetical protein n=1 Tax=Bacillus sonorensis TaxID=119858 RepID=UPI001F456978|nr:hypothetical protein [Bacillus sonorensis]MCF7618616.1 hypothetical protein [Bacillus sonorensis]MCY7858842.1 hypothetical protein [Bacillus sonorensis]